MKVILSIKPEFASKIFDGSKKYEFRRRLYKNTEVKAVIVYASAPISKVIGEFEIAGVLEKDLSSLWDETERYSGISEDYYHQYFAGKEKGFAIQVKKVTKYKTPLSIEENFGVKPPQSFAYVR